MVVVYSSWTGNTKKIADAIAKGMGCKSVSVKDAEIIKSGTLVVGAPTHFGILPISMYQYLRNSHPDRIAVFTTYGAPGWFGKWTSNRTLSALKKKGVNCVGEFKSTGFHPILRTYEGSPDINDLERAEQFGARIGSARYGANLWVNQNLPFFCGITQGFSKGMQPNEYLILDKSNSCSSPKWFRRGYVFGSSILPLLLLGLIIYYFCK